MSRKALSLIQWFDEYVIVPIRCQWMTRPRKVVAQNPVATEVKCFEFGDYATWDRVVRVQPAVRRIKKPSFPTPERFRRNAFGDAAESFEQSLAVSKHHPNTG